LFADINPPNSSEIIFGKENVICVYRENDADSYAFAKRYQQIRELEDDQLVSVPCSNKEILDSYADFQTEVETPLIQKIIQEPLSNRNIYAIVLMPFVPGGFQDGEDTISSTSRLSRIFYPFSKNSLNPLYNRQVFKRFDGYDASQCIICTRIDGPPIVVDSWLSNIEESQTRFTVSGDFYLDPYSAYNFSDVETYTNDLINFQTGYVDRLNLNVKSTSKPPSGKDAFFPKVQEDSFVWGWGSDGGSLSFFGSTTNIRAFFYNADTEGALTVRDLDSTKWPLLAIRSGYIATAGSVGSDDASSFLRPTPFMDALFRGATMGESFIFSQPYLDSSISCLGDPLCSFSFPSLVGVSLYSVVPAENTWQKVEDCLAQSIVCLYRKTNVLKSIRDHVVSGNDPDVQNDLDYYFDDLYKAYDETSWKNVYSHLSSSLISFAVDRNSTELPFFYPNLNQYLSYTGNKVAQIVLETLQDDKKISDLESSNIEKVGSWVFEDTLQSNEGSFRFYYLELEVAETMEDFDNNNQLFIKDTFDSSENWYYEDYNSNFQEMGDGGITSSFEGRKIRYVSSDNEKLTRGKFYWFRIRQKDELQNFDWRYFRQIVYK
jgi:uncharacterized protein (TIGR03790 family)